LLVVIACPIDAVTAIQVVCSGSDSGNSVTVVDDFKVGDDISVNEHNQIGFGPLSINSSRDFSGDGDVSAVQSYDGGPVTGQSIVQAEGSSVSLSSRADVTSEALNIDQSVQTCGGSSNSALEAGYNGMGVGTEASASSGQGLSVEQSASAGNSASSQMSYDISGLGTGSAHSWVKDGSGYNVEINKGGSDDESGTDQDGSSVESMVAAPSPSRSMILAWAYDPNLNGVIVGYDCDGKPIYGIINGESGSDPWTLCF